MNQIKVVTLQYGYALKKLVDYFYYEKDQGLRIAQLILLSKGEENLLPPKVSFVTNQEWNELMVLANNFIRSGLETDWIKYCNFYNKFSIER